LVFEAQVKRTSINSILESHKEKEMVAFRKVFPVLAIVALLLGSSITASAQVVPGTQPLACVANAGVPPVVRAEGLTELVGDIVLICTGGNPAAPFNVNMQVNLNTNITSRLLGTDLSEALLMIDEPGVARLDGAGGITPICLAPAGSNSVIDPALACNPATAPGSYQKGTYTAFRANASSSQPGAVFWPGIPFTPPGSAGQRVIRITNVRANASVIGAPSGFIPNQITAFIAASPSGTLPINNPQQTVAFVQRGLAFDVRSCADTSSGIPPSLAQCASFNSDVFNNPNRTSATAATFGLRFVEGFATAYKARIDPAQAKSLPGVVYNTESGFVRDDWNTADNNSGIIGIGNSGTRVAARFQDIPAGVKLFVTVLNVGSSTAGSSARLVQTGGFGEGGFAPGPGGGGLVPVGATTNISCGGSTPGGPPESPSLNAAEIPVTGGSGMAVWEITSSNPSAIETLFFYVTVAYIANPSAGTPPVGTGRVAGTYAPFYAGGNDPANAVGRASSSLPIPRFLQSTDLLNAFRIDACETNLLFPFVTNQAGFDTGIAISNTSADHFSSPQDRRQSGRCTLNYYGNVGGTGNAPNPQTTNADIPPGGQLTAVLSSGGNFGIAGTPNFQGYIFARCTFRYAHGFAFINSANAVAAEGYLALVVDGDEPNQPRGGAFGENLGH
jgi:hypothetical protein